MNETVTERVGLLDDVEPTVDPWSTARVWSKVVVYIGFVSLVICMSIGTVLNLISVVIFIANKMSRTAVGLHLICLSIADASVCLMAIFIAFWGFGRQTIPGYLYPIDR